MRLRALYLAAVIFASNVAMAFGSEPIRIDRDSFSLALVEHRTVGYSTYFTRLALQASSYEEYMELYPLIVVEAQDKHQAFLREDPNYLVRLPPKAMTCAFTNAR